MSGTKTFTLTEGVSPTATLGALVAGAAVAGGVVGVAMAAGAVVSLTGRALQAYQERQRRERETALQREKEIQQRIAQIKAGIGSSSTQRRVAVKLPDPTGQPNVNQAGAKDAQRRVDELRNRLPKIRTEYQTLIEQQLLDAETVQQAIKRTQQALNANNLADAEAHLQALDDARIQGMQHLRSQMSAHIPYLQERLNGLRSRIPQTVIQDIQSHIDQVQSNWQQMSDADSQELHQHLSALEAQAEQIQEAAENLVKSWLEVGYVARVLGTDDGDVVIEVETHEGANTQMRMQFEGQQIDLFGPKEESSSCADRTIEVLQTFQQQGYQMEWTSLDGQPVPEEWRYLYTEVHREESAKPTFESYKPSSSQRRLENEGCTE